MFHKYAYRLAPLRSRHSLHAPAAAAFTTIRPAARPGASTNGAPVGTSGSRNGRLRWTGPAGTPVATATAKASIASATAADPAPRITDRRDAERMVGLEIRL